MTPETIEAYLASKRTVLWGCSFDLLEKDSYDEAKQFINRLYNDLVRLECEIECGDLPSEYYV